MRRQRPTDLQDPTRAPGHPACRITDIQAPFRGNLPPAAVPEPGQFPSHQAEVIIHRRRAVDTPDTRAAARIAEAALTRAAAVVVATSAVAVAVVGAVTRVAGAEEGAVAAMPAVAEVVAEEELLAIIDARRRSVLPRFQLVSGATLPNEVAPSIFSHRHNAASSSGDSASARAFGSVAVAVSAFATKAAE